MIHRSSLPPVDIPLLSLPEFVLQRAAEVSDKPAPIDGLTGRRLTYGELAEGAKRTVGGLAAGGFRRGDAFAIWSQNVPEYAVALNGAALAGGVVTTINPLYNAIEPAHQLRDAGARVLVTAPRSIDTALRAAKSAGVKDVSVFERAEGAVPLPRPDKPRAGKP